MMNLPDIIAYDRNRIELYLECISGYRLYLYGVQDTGEFIDGLHDTYSSIIDNHDIDLHEFVHNKFSHVEGSVDLFPKQNFFYRNFVSTKIDYNGFLSQLEKDELLRCLLKKYDDSLLEIPIDLLYLIINMQNEDLFSFENNLISNADVTFYDFLENMSVREERLLENEIYHLYDKLPNGTLTDMFTNIQVLVTLNTLGVDKVKDLIKVPIKILYTILNVHTARILLEMKAIYFDYSRTVIEILEHSISILNERELLVLSKRTGWFGKKRETLEELGKFLGITRERVRQIESKSKEKIVNASKIKRSFIREHIESLFIIERTIYLDRKFLSKKIIGYTDMFIL